MKDHLQEAVILGPQEEARRLWLGATAGLDQPDPTLVSLCESLDLGLRAAEILVVQRLQPVADRFPATIGMLLEAPAPEIDVHRDAVAVPRSLEFSEALDLLSAPSLDCVGPYLHRGWEDRAFSCRRSRKTAQDQIGIELGAAEREQLLALSAYRNRVFRLPPPVRLVPEEIRSAFPTRVSLVERLRAA